MSNDNIIEILYPLIDTINVSIRGFFMRLHGGEWRKPLSHLIA